MAERAALHVVVNARTENKVSGGKLLSSQTQPSANRAATAFRLAAASLGRTQTALGAFYRRLAARTGKPQAATATARKLAVLVYRDPGADSYDAQQRVRQLRQLRQRATRLGFALVSHETGEVLGREVFGSRQLFTITTHQAAPSPFAVSQPILRGKRSTAAPQFPWNFLWRFLG